MPTVPSIRAPAVGATHTDLSRVEPLHGGGGVEEATSRGVDDHRAGLEQADGVLVDQVSRLVLSAESALISAVRSRKAPLRELLPSADNAAR